MKQMTFLVSLSESDRLDEEKIKRLMGQIDNCLAAKRASGFSAWQAENMLFGYYELWKTEKCPEETGLEVRRILEQGLGIGSVIISSPGNMRLMYEVVNNPQKEKTGLVYRVFIVRLKPNSAEEYKARHDRARAQAGELEGCQNFTCWQGGDYVCGYKETRREDVEPGSTNDGGDEAWERYMLQIMDWLTNDADRFSGETHEAIKLLYRSTL